MREQELYVCLVKKLQILDKIIANTGAQLRFINKLQLKGLQRVLAERECLIGELSAVNQEIARLDKVVSPKINSLLSEINEKQTLILKNSAQALQNAVIEQNNIKGRLKSIKTGRKLQHGYFNQWRPNYRSHINVKS